MRKRLLIIGTLFVLLPSLSAQEGVLQGPKSRPVFPRAWMRQLQLPYEDGVVYITESTSVGASSPTDSRGRRLFTMFRVSARTAVRKSNS